MFEPNWSVAAPVLVTMHFTVRDRIDFLAQARVCVDLLRSRVGCLGVEVLQSVDSVEQMLITTRWQDMGSYRKAMSAYEVKEKVIPFLSRARDDDSTFEVLVAAHADDVRTYESGLSADADRTSLGTAGTPSAPRLDS
ncbi:MAG: antibiotic biosynthesis monooxygenase [Actinobacteria bacterium]|nr:antibiotic biosynthesis monooxygenase [Actinomycetota bacterium]